MAEDAGTRLLLEPLIDRVDHPGMFLCSTRLGLDVVEKVGNDGLKLLYDAYHSSVMGESAAEVLAGRMEFVGHVQVADNPGARPVPGISTGISCWPCWTAKAIRDCWASNSNSGGGSSEAKSVTDLRAQIGRDRAEGIVLVGVLEVAVQDEEHFTPRLRYPHESAVNAENL